MQVPSICIRNILKNAGINLVNTRGKRRRKIPKELNIKIGSEYQSGKSLERIAADHSVGRDAIKRAILESGGTIRETCISNHLLSSEQQKELCELYIDGMNTVSLGRKYGLWDSTIRNYLIKNNIELRQGRLTSAQKNTIIEKYINGASSVDLSMEFDVSPSLICRTLKEGVGGARRHGETLLLKTESKVNVSNVCSRYLDGESSIALAKEYDTTPTTIVSILKRNNVEIRGSVGADSIMHALNKTGNFAISRETYFYIYSINGFGDLHKIGIAVDLNDRALVSNGVYKDEIFSALLSSREEAFFLEQAILDETSAYWEAPDQLVRQGFSGITELRHLNANQIVDIYEYYFDQINDLGAWKFACDYLSMTENEYHRCLEMAGKE